MLRRVQHLRNLSNQSNGYYYVLSGKIKVFFFTWHRVNDIAGSLLRATAVRSNPPTETDVPADGTALPPDRSSSTSNDRADVDIEDAHTPYLLYSNKHIRTAAPAALMAPRQRQGSPRSLVEARTPEERMTHCVLVLGRQLSPLCAIIHVRAAVPTVWLPRVP